ncbi:MAG: vitamin B12 dependent methionine synthase [Firmicutes bacterium]|nr:vitamin B12 dependent methionine synthase [Bacillota bacterium]
MIEVLDSIPVELDAESLMKACRIQPMSDDADAFQSLIDKALAIARPKAVYREAFIEDRSENTVVVDGVTFTSSVLARNLANVERVFAFVATCGNEMDQANLPSDDFLAEYWWDQIKAAALGCASRYLSEHLKGRFRVDKTAQMHPGSGDAEVWPIQQQKELFSLLGDVRGLIGVELTDSFLMVPNKSVSGIVFATERDFHSCQLCHRENCPNRTAPFEEKLWSEMSGKPVKLAGHA